MKKIIGWFKNILMRILEVVNYMIKKDNEIELAKLEIAKDVLKDKKTLSCVAIGIGVAGLLLNSSNLLADKNVRFILGLTGVAALCTCFYDFNKTSVQNI